MRELTSIKKTKTKHIFQLSEEDFRAGKWCSDKDVVPTGDMVELSYTSRNGILVVHNTPEINVKKLDSEKEEKKND